MDLPKHVKRKKETNQVLALVKLVRPARAGVGGHCFRAVRLARAGKMTNFGQTLVRLGEIPTALAILGRGWLADGWNSPHMLRPTM